MSGRNKLFSVIFLLITSAGSMTTSHAQTRDVTFSLSDFNVVRNVDTVEISTSNPDYFFSEEEGKPEIPYTTIVFDVNDSIIDVTYDIEDIQLEAIHENVYLYENMLPISPGDPIPAREISTQHALDPVLSISIGRFRERSRVYIALSPFVYDNYEKSLSFISSIRISLAQTQGSAAELSAFRPIQVLPEDLLKNIFFPSALDMMRDPELVIITTRALKPAFKALSKWKMCMGIYTEVLAVEDIYANYPDQATNQLKIKQCLYDMYKTGLKWVLLGGDIDVVPTQMCSFEKKSYLETGTKVTPCDQFYAGFDGVFDWNLNGNDYIGEIDDRIDLEPELSIGRIPVRDSMDVVNFTNKLLKYEKDPALSNYVNRMLLAGSKLDDSADSYIVAQNKYNNYIDPYWSGTCKYLFDTYSDFGDTYKISPTNLSEQINSGYHFVNVDSHGVSYYWKFSETSKYNTAHAAVQTNENASIIVTEACNTNAFDSACLSKAFMNNSTGGALAYWGCSREGFCPNNGDPKGGVSTRFVSEFFTALLRGDTLNSPHTLGDAVTLSKIKNSVTGYYAEKKLNLYKGMNLLGDPSMTVYTENPQTFTNVKIGRDEFGKVHVSTGGVEDCTISVIAEDDLCLIPIHRISNHVSKDTYEPPLHSTIITISKHNYKPYVHATDVDDIYIQNRTFSESKSMSGENIFIGRNIIDTKEQGNVVISSGAELTLDATSSIVLDKGTVCEPGASLILK